MPLITDGDITRGFIRERRLIKRIYELTVLSKSPMLREYVKGVSEVTGLPPRTVLKSRPVRRFFEKISGSSP
jgi:hypothetical protein